MEGALGAMAMALVLIAVFGGMRAGALPPDTGVHGLMWAIGFGVAAIAAAYCAGRCYGRPPTPPQGGDNG